MNIKPTHSLASAWAVAALMILNPAGLAHAEKHSASPHNLAMKIAYQPKTEDSGETHNRHAPRSAVEPSPDQDIRMSPIPPERERISNSLRQFFYRGPGIAPNITPPSEQPASASPMESTATSNTSSTTLDDNGWAKLRNSAREKLFQAPADPALVPSM